MSSKETSLNNNNTNNNTLTVEQFCRDLAAQQPTPGGGAAAAVSAAMGAAAAHMAAAYTQRPKDVASGAAAHADTCRQCMDIAALLETAHADAAAYQALQRTWKKDCAMTQTEIQAIQAQALHVPTQLVEACHARIQAIQKFWPHCNPNITSDAAVGIHLLAGAARAAYQTVLVNRPPAEHKARLVTLLQEIQQIEMDLLE